MLTLPFTRRRVAPPALPARHPRRCRKCGGLIIPDRSRRYGGFARPDLVDAMGFQIKPGSGFQIKPGQGFEYADSTKPCCCTTTGCGCTYCSGLTQTTDLTVVISGMTICTCIATAGVGGGIWQTLLTNPNGTYQIHCVTGSTACRWTETTQAYPVSIDTYDNAACTLFNSNISAYMAITLVNNGSGSLTITLVINFAARSFLASTTTTTANACSFATPVTFSPNAESTACSTPRYCVGGSITVSA